MDICCPLARWIDWIGPYRTNDPRVVLVHVFPYLTFELDEVGGGRGDRRSRMGEHYRGGTSGCSGVGSSRGPGAGEGSTAAVRVEGNDGYVYGSSDGKEGKEETGAAGVDVEGELG